jgi:hypothetical protein
MKTCICKLNKPGEIDDKVGLAIGGIMITGLVAILVAATPQVVPWVTMAVLCALLLRYAYPLRREGHSLKCAVRRGLLEVLTLGNFISP